MACLSLVINYKSHKYINIVVT